MNAKSVLLRNNQTGKIAKIPEVLTLSEDEMPYATSPILADKFDVAPLGLIRDAEEKMREHKIEGNWFSSRFWKSLSRTTWS